MKNLMTIKTMLTLPLFIFVLIVTTLVSSAEQNTLRPLVMIHGLSGSYQKLEALADRVQQDFPNMEVFSLDALNGEESWVSLDKQVEVFNEMVQNITDEYGDITLLGFSQGGVVARAIIEMYENPNIHTFIALSSPITGEYGIPLGARTPSAILSSLPKTKVWEVCYNPFGQKIAPCNYWKDPTHQTLYKLANNFLPKLDNEVKHKSSNLYKTNFENIRHLQLIGGPDDGVIIPWQSAQFGFYDSDLNVIPMEEQQFFKENLFGLKTLSDEGRVSKCTVAGVEHLNWISNEKVYIECIKESLL